jgi:hypothetical protein
MASAASRLMWARSCSWACTLSRSWCRRDVLDEAGSADERPGLVPQRHRRERHRDAPPVPGPAHRLEARGLALLGDPRRERALLLEPILRHDQVDAASERLLQRVAEDGRRHWAPGDDALLAVHHDERGAARLRRPPGQVRGQRRQPHEALRDPRQRAAGVEDRDRAHPPGLRRRAGAPSLADALLRLAGAEHQQREAVRAALRVPPQRREAVVAPAEELGRGGAHERVRELDAHLPVDQRDADAQRGQRVAERGQVLGAGQPEQGGHARGL